jgi:hypothetical protein
MKRLLLAVILSLLLSTGAHAALVTYNFVGAVSYLDDPGGYFGYSPGQRVPVSLTLDTSVPDADPSPHHGDYGNAGFGRGALRPLVQLTIGSNTIFGQEWQWLDIYNDIVDANGDVRDEISGSATTVKGPTISFSFQAINRDALQSDALGQALDPEQFDYASVGMNLRVGFPPYLDVDLEHAVTGVPEPSALAMFGAALLGLTWLRRKAGTA